MFQGKQGYQGYNIPEIDLKFVGISGARISMPDLANLEANLRTFA